MSPRASRRTPCHLNTIAIGACSVILLPLAIGCSNEPGKSSSAPPPSQQTGHVTLDPPAIDLQQRPPNSMTKFDVAIHNNLAEAIVLVRAITSCGCTVLNADDELVGRIVEPGDTFPFSGTIRADDSIGLKSSTIQVQYQRVSEASHHAPAQGTAHVHATDESHSNVPSVAAVIRLNVVASFELSPTALRFPDTSTTAQADEAESRTVVFTSERFELGGMPTTDCEWIAVSDPQFDGSQWSFEVSLRPPSLIPGPNHGSIMLPTTDPDNPMVFLGVSAFGVHEVLAAPAHVFIRAGQDVQRVTFTSADGEPVQVKSVDCDNPLVQAHVTDDGQAVLVSVTQRPAAEDIAVTVETISGVHTSFRITGL